jgi:hypothetical protein
VDDGEGCACGLGELVRPGGVLPALLVGVVLEDDVLGVGDREELRAADGVRLDRDEPDRGRLVVPLLAVPCLPPAPD